MTRSFFAAVSTMFVAIALAPAFLEGCQATGVGDPCTPEQEYNQDFLGFDVKEVNVESKSFQCQTRLCLVNHFQGRVSCQYGQDATGANLPNGLPFANGAAACVIPGATTRSQDTQINGAVQAQCTDRDAKSAVYCSCRCQDVNGQTPASEGNFCKCPDGYTCQQLVTSIGASDTGLTGGYCIKSGTAYQPTQCASTCDPTTQPCNK
jgi:hypothetical protein